MKKILLLSFNLITLLMSCAAQNKGLTIDYPQGNATLEGYVAKPAKFGKAPGVVIIHAWMGITDHEKTTADRLSALGYYAFDADIYGKGIRPKSPKEAGALARQYEGQDYKTYIARIQSAIDQIIKQGADPDNIAVIGYCFGGFGAISAARNNMAIKGIVSFHGGLLPDPDKSASVIQPRLLIQHGADDPNQPKGGDMAIQEELRERKADWQMIYFGNTVHSFTDPSAGSDNSKGAAYNEKSDKRSWQYMLDFFKEIFGE